MKVLTDSDLREAALAHCNEQTRIAGELTGREASPCMQPCEACIGAMRTALRGLAEKLELVVPDESSTSMH